MQAASDSGALGIDGARPPGTSRFTVAALILGVALAFGFGKPRPRRPSVAWLGVAGLLNAVGYALVYRAEQELAGGVTAVIFGTMPLITAAIAGVTGTERLRASAVAGALVGLAGIALIFRDRMAVSRRATRRRPQGAMIARRGK